MEAQPRLSYKMTDVLQNIQQNPKRSTYRVVYSPSRLQNSTRALTADNNDLEQAYDTKIKLLEAQNMMLIRRLTSMEDQLSSTQAQLSKTRPLAQTQFQKMLQRTNGVGATVKNDDAPKFSPGIFRTDQTQELKAQLK